MFFHKTSHFYQDSPVEFYGNCHNVNTVKILCLMTMTLQAAVDLRSAIISSDIHKKCTQKHKFAIFTLKLYRIFSLQYKIDNILQTNCAFSTFVFIDTSK